MSEQSNTLTAIKQTKTLPAEISVFKQKFAEHFAEYVCLGRKTVHAAWFAGEALCAVKDRLHHGEFRLFLASEGVNRETARGLMRLAREIQMTDLLSFGSVSAALKSLPAKTPVNNPLDPSEPTKAEVQEFEQEVALAVAEDEALAGAKHVHISANSGENEWYTPPDIVDTVRAVLGDFLDPASCAAAQETVKAESYFTIEDNGLEQEWAGNVFMNPPYERGLVDQFIDKLVTEKGVGDWIVLVNNATDTAWGQTLLRHGRAVCFVSRRVRFLSPDGERGAPLQGQMIVGKVSDSKKFVDAFGEHGRVCLCETGGANIHGLSDALAVQTERAEETWNSLEMARRETKKLKRRLSAIRNDMTGGREVSDILALHYGIAVEAALGVQESL